MAYTIQQLKKFQKADLIQTVMDFQTMIDHQSNVISNLEENNKELEEKAKYSCNVNEYQLLLALRIFMSNQKDEMMKMMQDVSMSCHKYIDDKVQEHDEYYHYNRNMEE